MGFKNKALDSSKLTSIHIINFNYYGIKVTNKDWQNDLGLWGGKGNEGNCTC